MGPTIWRQKSEFILKLTKKKASKKKRKKESLLLKGEQVLAREQVSCEIVLWGQRKDQYKPRARSHMRLLA